MNDGTAMNDEPPRDDAEREVPVAGREAPIAGQRSTSESSGQVAEPASPAVQANPAGQAVPAGQANPAGERLAGAPGDEGEPAEAGSGEEDTRLLVPKIDSGDDPEGPTVRLGAEPGGSLSRVTPADEDTSAAEGEPGGGRPAVEVGGTDVEGDTPVVPDKSPWKRLSDSTSGPMIWILLAVFGFTLVAQLRSNNDDQGLAGARQEDLVRILSDLDSRDSRLQTEISNLEDSQRQLTSGVAGRQAALAEAGKRADELGLLAGTLPGKGPGLQIVMSKVKASAVLNCVEELRGSGGEVMQIAGADGTSVRIVASSYFVDAEGGGILVDGSRLGGPYTIMVIGSPQTMQPALQIPGGVVASVNSAGGSVTMEARSSVDVTAVRKSTTMQYARPVS